MSADDVGHGLALEELLAVLPAPTLTTAARVLAVGHKRVHRWGREGLTVDEADEMAGKLKLHPSEVWPSWWVAVDVQTESDLAAKGIVCASWGCETVFLPPKVGGSKRWPPRFCSARCRAREKMRRHRGFTPPAPKVCEAKDCAASFVPVIHRPDQRFCSRTCRNRVKMRRYRSVPAVAERHRLGQRRYRREVTELKARRRQAEIARRAA